MKIKVNSIRCKGSGQCMELFPERIQADDWGYPIISQEPILPEMEEHARRAVSACPVLALWLDQGEGK